MRVTVVNPKKKRIPLRKVKAVAESTMKRFSVDKDVSICFVDDVTIRQYNKQFLNKDRPTDVLAFEGDDNVYLGDVIISVDTARANARQFKTTFDEELLLYVIHGVLHLLGFDDTTDTARKKMQRTQKTILRTCLS